MGRPKAEVAAMRLSRLNPGCDIRVVTDRLTAANAAGLLGGHDAVVDCTDNYDARYVIDDFCREAEVLVVAAGKPKVVDETYLSEGQIVIDVGINMGDDGKLCGDVDFEPCAQKASYITPVPGGVGPMTIAMLMNNCVEAARKKRRE